jgi:hypothetical protein
MSTQVAIVTTEAVRIGAVRVRMQGMYQDDQVSTTIALSFCGADLCGLSVDFHGSTSDMRSFAAELIRHADVTEAAQAAGLVSA